MKSIDKENPDELVSKLHTLAAGFRDNYLNGREPDLEAARLMAGLWLRLDEYLTYSYGRLPGEWGLESELKDLQEEVEKSGRDLDEKVAEMVQKLSDLEADAAATAVRMVDLQKDLQKAQLALPDLKKAAAEARAEILRSLKDAGERLQPKPKEEKLASAKRP